MTCWRSEKQTSKDQPSYNLPTFKSVNLSENNAKDEWLTLEQLIEYLPGNVKPRTVYDWVHKREVPFHKRRNALFFLKSEIDAWTQIKKNKKMNKEQLFKGVTDENRIIK